MQREAVTTQQIEEWKKIFEKYKRLLVPNRKTGLEMVDYIKEKYKVNKFKDDEANKVVYYNVMENETLKSKLKGNKKPKPVTFYWENENKKVFIGVDVVSGFYCVEDNEDLWDELCAFQGLDEDDLTNYYCVAEYINCLNKFDMLDDVMKKMEYEKVLIDYEFLKEIKSQHGEHIEVTEEAIEIYSEYYDEYKKDWKVHKFRGSRNQMSTSGAWLFKKNEKTIDIVGDILTAKSAFKLCKDMNNEVKDLYNLFARIYHTSGNCIPWCEGCNLGGKPYKEGGSPDFFTRKLNECKKVFDETNDTKYRSTDIVTYRINQKNASRYLGRGVSDYTCLHYWITSEWKDKGKNWEDFLKEHYLIDMVDKNFNPIPFVVGTVEDNLAGKSDDVIKSTLIQSIKLIIKRGYRIHKRIKEPFNTDDDNDKNVKKIFADLGI